MGFYDDCKMAKEKMRKMITANIPEEVILSEIKEEYSYGDRLVNRLYSEAKK